MPTRATVPIHTLRSAHYRVRSDVLLTSPETVRGGSSTEAVHRGS
jgi:hypothetical protein